jgi:hypothetical protein
MKKLIIAAAALAATLAGTSSFAQSGSAGCQAGSGWGSSAPGCNDASNTYPPADALGNSGWTPPAYIYTPSRGYVPYAGSPYYSYNVPRYSRNRRDRDGDGIPNSRDRYPDDPRWY